MADNANRPGLVRRIAPWLLAIGVGIGVGWLVGGQFASDRPAADIATRTQDSTPPAPPPTAPAEKGAAVTPPRTLGPPITLAISNRDCNWGADYESYYRQAATILQHAGEQAGREAESVRVRVPDRPWNGLTVTAVEALFGGSGIVFAEPETEVRAALVSAGVRIASDGGIPLDDGTEGTVIQAIMATEGNARRYGATALRCGS